MKPRLSGKKKVKRLSKRVKKNLKTTLNKKERQAGTINCPCLFNLSLKNEVSINLKLTKNTEVNKNAENDGNKWNFVHKCDIIILIINV